MAAVNKSIAAKMYQAGPCCLDEESGLFTPAHFRSVLIQELARLDRWERPLSLVLLEISGLAGDSWPIFSRLLRDSLRRIDLAARLTPDRVAVLMPDADAAWVRRWLCSFGCEIARQARFSALTLRYGQVLARPWSGLGPDDLLALALTDLVHDDFSVWDEGEEQGDGEGSATAIAADERSLLFAGFKTLGLN